MKQLNYGIDSITTRTCNAIHLSNNNIDGAKY